MLHIEKRSKVSHGQKKVLTLHNEISCIINFLSLLVAILEKHNFSIFKRVCLCFFAAHELQSTALEPDYGLFIGYQMPTDKHEGLNQGCATIYLNGPKCTIVIMLQAGQCSANQKQLLLLHFVCKKNFSINLNEITEKLAAQYANVSNTKSKTFAYFLKGHLSATPL